MSRTWTLSNTLTMLRIAFVPLFVWVALFETVSMDFLAIVVFLLASLTDHYDGKLARLRDEITDFGTLADPIADKALIGSALIILSMRGVFPWWATGLIMVREVGITIWRIRIRNQQVHAANYGGKLKTTLQIAGVGFAFWPIDGVGGVLLNPFGVTLLWAALVVTLYTGIIYIREFRSA